MQAQQEKLWTRSLIVLMGVNFCSALSFYLIMVKITEFAIATYGVTPSVGGLTITAYVISALFTRIFFGRKIDIWGVKRSLVMGAAVNTVAMLMYLLPLSFEALMVVRLVHGFSFALMTGASSAGAALVIPRSRYGEGIGYYSMMQALATGVGPFVAILITNVFGGYFPMFACAAVVAALALASLPLLEIPRNVHLLGTTQQETGKDDAAGKANGSDEAASGTDSAASGADAAASGDTANQPADSPKQNALMRAIGSYVQLSVVPIASVLFMAYLGYAGILSFITSYADERGLSDAVTLYFVVYAAVIFVTRPPIGRYVDRKGENVAIYCSLGSLAIGFIVLAFAGNGVMLLLSAALIGFGIGATQSVIQAVIARDTPPSELGRANSTFMMSMDLGSGIGPVVIGAFIPLIGYSACYLVLALVSACAIVVYYVVHGRKQPRRP